MAALYVDSMGDAAGKSTLCVGLGRMSQANGKKTGFLKPVSVQSGEIDKDAALVKQALSLEEPVDSLCPVSISVKDLAATLDEKELPWLKIIEEAFTRVSQGKDEVLLEGASDFRMGSDSARVSCRIIESLKAKAILLIRYRADVEEDQILDAAKMLNGNLLGVVINAVPERRMELIKSQIVPFLEKKGISVLGALPEERALFAATVDELAGHIGGSILNCEERSNELVESLMVGALSPDSALSYLNLKHNKAVITRGDHADIQLAALNTSTKCLVLTGNVQPLPTILNRAIELEVPIIVVEKDTTSTMEALEGVLDKAGSYNEQRIERLVTLLEKNLDLKTIFEAA